MSDVLRSIAHPRPSRWRRLLGLVLPRPAIDPAPERVEIVIPEPSEPPTLVGKLRAIAALQHGDQFPRWIYEDGSWGTKLSRILNEAADKIEHLRDELRDQRGYYC